jgi:hypothetical protein
MISGLMWGGEGDERIFCMCGLAVEVDLLSHLFSTSLCNERKFTWQEDIVAAVENEPGNPHKRH